MTNYDGATDYEDISNKVSEFKPSYPGKKGVAAPERPEPQPEKKDPVPNKPVKMNSVRVHPMKNNLVEQAENLKHSKTMNKSHLNDKSQGDIVEEEQQQANNEDAETDSLGGNQEIIPEDEQWKDRKCFWQMNAQNRIRWDLFIMCLATYN